MSVKPEIKIGVLLGRCPAGRQALATWALLVVPFGMPLRGPDMSDMRRFGVTVETPDSEESMAVGLSGPLGRDGAALAANTAAYVAPSPDEPGCRLLEAACSPVADVVTGRGVGPAPVAGRRLAGSAEPPELALLLPASSVLLPLAVVVPLFTADTTGTVLRPFVERNHGLFIWLVGKSSRRGY